METSREKKIEEKRDLSDIIYWSGYGFDRGTCNDIARQIQEQGYCKAADIVHKTIAAVKIKCKRVSYPDGKGTKETFFIEAKDLDEIEKSILGGDK